MSKTNITQQKRINCIDIAKGLGIIMIVWGHAKGVFSSQFILLAVPLFFLMSGFFHNSEESFKTFFKKKFFRLYIPFVCCNLFLPTLTLIKCHSLGLNITPNLIYISQILLTLNKDGFLFGATWFLASLFIISITIKLIETIIKTKYKEILVGLCCLGLAGVAFMPVFNLDFGIKRTFLCSLFYFIGILIKKYWDKLSNIPWHYITLVTSIATITLWRICPSFSYKTPTVSGFIMVLICSIAFSTLILQCSILIEKRTKKASSILTYIGKNSIHVLIWHFVFFEIITAILLYANHLPITIIETLPHVICETPFCIGCYFSAGLFGSLGLAYIYKTFYNKIKSKLTIL